MRSVFAAMIMLSASAAMVLPVEAQNETANRSFGHRQLMQDYTRIEKDNEELDLPPTQDVTGAYEVQSEENVVGETIERENEQLDRQLRAPICRGC